MKHAVAAVAFVVALVLSACTPSTPSPQPTPSVPSPTPSAAVPDIEAALVSLGQRERYGRVVMDIRSTGPGSWDIPSATDAPSLVFFMSCSPSSSYTVTLDGRDLFGGGSCRDVLTSNDVPKGFSDFKRVAVEVDDVPFQLLILEGVAAASPDERPLKAVVFVSSDTILKEHAGTGNSKELALPILPNHYVFYVICKGEPLSVEQIGGDDDGAPKSSPESIPCTLTPHRSEFLTEGAPAALRVHASPTTRWAIAVGEP